MKAILNNFRGSPKRFIPYLKAIQNKQAINICERLRFVPSPYCVALRKLILSAIANAANDPNINVNDLVISNASVGRGVFLKRVCFRGRGRVGRVTKYGSNVSICLSSATIAQVKKDEIKDEKIDKSKKVVKTTTKGGKNG